jgi:hypothetical protein
MSPDSDSPTVSEGQSLTFEQTSFDPDGDSFSVNWYLDYVNVATTQNWAYTPGYGDAGYHTVTLVLSDGEKNTELQWDVTVKVANSLQSNFGYQTLGTTGGLSYEGVIRGSVFSMVYIGRQKFGLAKLNVLFIFIRI